MAIKLSDGKKKYYTLIIKLLASVINGGEPPLLPESFNWRYACSFAQRNSVANIMAYTLDRVNVKPDQTVYNVLENDRRYQILKETSQLVDIEKVIEEFDRRNIRNIPLKGYFMKHYYPRSDFRTMSDVDILIDRKSFKKAEKVFLEQGFEKESLMKAAEIHFKKGLLYVEVHSDLNEGGDLYYSGVFDRAKLREGYACSFELSPEDFYIYTVYHAAKHFSGGGIGIRMVMDIYVYLSRFDVDYAYIDRELDSIGLLSFEHRLRALAFNWFSDEQTEIDGLGEFILYCSTFGNIEVHFYRDKKKSEKFFALKQVFIPYKNMKGRYAYLEKLPFLLPFSWGQYWFHRLLISRDIKFKKGIRERTHRFDDEDMKLLDNVIDELKI